MFCFQFNRKAFSAGRTRRSFGFARKLAIFGGGLPLASNVTRDLQRDMTGFIINADELDLKDYKVCRPFFCRCSSSAPTTRSFQRPKRQAPYGSAPPHSGASTYSAPAAAAAYKQPPARRRRRRRHRRRHPAPTTTSSSSISLRRRPPTSSRKRRTNIKNRRRRKPRTHTAIRPPSSSYAAMPATEASPEPRNEHAASSPAQRLLVGN